MQSALKISDAAVIGLHAADHLASGKKPLYSARELAKALGASYNHLSKVLQRLTKAGLLSAERGPSGGFSLSETGKKASLRTFITAVDGPPVLCNCLIKNKVCARRACILGDFIRETNRRFEAALDKRIFSLTKRN